ncbi:InlB B-repeat-containing protein [Roseburia sp. AM16-25]|uniref:InlB B-repeat-containing protein n=1 Tax=Roseburia sp. AM16-25 TaxID=2292065 RepID=UPI000E4E52B1|nr:hypothetical protein [Roseburia sp. AM16-25]RHO31715.1 hypothetical protein DW183_04200 [Roseburia sp. AM16-25]
MKKTKGRMRGILSLVLAMLLTVTMIPAQKVLAEGEAAGSTAENTGNLTFASFESTDISHGEVQWKNGDADTWHTQTTTGDVTATNVRIVVKKNANLGQHMALRINGQDILQTNLETLKSNEGLKLQADGKYQFEHIGFSSAAGGSGGEENPPQPPKPPVSQGIEFVLEGNARDKFGEMIAAGNDANNIYVKVNEDTSYQKINDLIKSKMVTVSQDGRYQFADSVKKVSLYVKYDTNYMVQFMPNVAGMGFSENAPLVLDGSGSQHIQIDKKVNTITWAYDDVRYGKDAYLEHGTAEIIAVNGTPVAQLPKDPDNFAANAGNKDGGHFAADPGAKITIKLTPDYGYQLSGVQLNGGATLEAQKDVSTFTFTMPDTSVHFKGIFTKSEDAVVTTGNTVKNAAIANGANATNSGNLELKVSDNTNYNTAAATALVSDAVAAEAVDLSLNQVVSKGNGTNWETGITEFEKPITLSLALKDYDANYDYTVVRNHNGKLTALDTTAINGTVSFATNQFSTYVIVKKEKSKTPVYSTEANAGAGAPQTTFSQTTKELLDAIGLTAAEKKAIANGANVNVVLNVNVKTLTEKEAKLIESVIGKNKMAETYDINLLLQIAGLADRNITDPSSAIGITITIPDKFINTDTSVKRVYRMVRIHDGKATVIDGTFDANTKQFTFATDGFSTYALVYEDVAATTTTPATTSPKTNDTSLPIAWLLLLGAGLCGCMAVTLVKKKIK